MCKCNPSIRTPFCGKEGCEWPVGKIKPKPAFNVEMFFDEKIEQYKLYVGHTWAGNFETRDDGLQFLVNHLNVIYGIKYKEM